MAHTLIGTVTSDQRDKTITVSISSRETHPLYRKQYTKTRKYTAHDENNEAHLGDRVQIKEVAPISKTKTYTLVKILERSHGAVELKEEVEKVDLPEKIGADEMARNKKAAEEVEERLEAEIEEAANDVANEVEDEAAEEVEEEIMDDEDSGSEEEEDL